MILSFTSGPLGLCSPLTNDYNTVYFSPVSSDGPELSNVAIYNSKTATLEIT